MGGGEDPEDRDGGYCGPKTDEAVGEDCEPLGDETKPVHVVACVEMKTEETHPEARGQQDDVSDSQADEVFHGDG